VTRDTYMIRHGHSDMADPKKPEYGNMESGNTNIQEIYVTNRNLQRVGYVLLTAEEKN